MLLLGWVGFLWDTFLNLSDNSFSVIDMQMDCYVNGMAVSLPGDGFMYIDGLPHSKSPRQCARKKVTRALYSVFVDGSNPDDAGVTDISIGFNCSEYKRNNGVWAKPSGEAMSENDIERVEQFLTGQTTKLANKYIPTKKKVQVDCNVTS